MQQLKLLLPKKEGFFLTYDAFQFYWRHPWTRLIFVVSLWTLDLYIFGEDPTSYSSVPCRIPGAGHILNLFLSFFAFDVPLQWHLLRLALLFSFVTAGLFISKKLKRRLALRFEMFTYKGSYFIIGAAVITTNLFLCALFYNFLWRMTCSESCDCEDEACLPGILSSNLHIPTNVFARLTQCGAFLADTLAVFSVLDLILQDQSVYDFRLCSGLSGLDLHSFWERNRTRVLWGSFTVIATSGVIVLAFFGGKVLNSYQLSPSMHRSNIGRMVVAGMLFVIDVCIVTQDLDFPHFENSLEVKLLGTNIAFEGSFINYSMVFVSMLLDLNCLYTLGWYDPFAYGQYYLTNALVCNRRNISDLLEVNCSSPSCPAVQVDQERWANLTTCGDDEPLSVRFYPIGYRSFLAAAPILCGILLFCSLFRLAGRSPQNLCRRVVISNAFAVRRVQEKSS